jgi:ribosomal protein S17
VTTTKKVMAHDETNEIPMGAIVRVVESKPLSKNKRWVVETVLETPDVVLGPVDAGLADSAEAGEA